MTTPADEQYTEASFWEKLKKFGKKAGVKVVYTALLLFYCLRDGNVPPWAKTVIVGALAYFINPVDAIPDVVPVVGFTDDLGALVAALGTVAVYINDDIRHKARTRLAEWFGADALEELAELDQKLVK
ncbi:YkvA family protein [Paenibacillus sp. SYP-B4298]|uniref:YkvA family protein n=1 Tax=Paenibacillus sp. SYP-B4298 TaxID=2996034 RepID=UPI0022DE0DA8|nr:YkvA family protein [Paenibacillus sp. SYP-B4298]